MKSTNRLLFVFRLSELVVIVSYGGRAPQGVPLRDAPNSAARRGFEGESEMPFSGISIRKSTAPSLPTSSGVYAEEKPMRGRAGARGVCGTNASVYGAVVITSLVWLVLLHVSWVRDWAILCGRGEIGSAERFAKAGSGSGGYGLSYIASTQDDGVGSGLVELMDGEGKRSEALRPKVLAFVGINTGFDSGPRRKALRETWFPSTPEGLNK